MLLKPSTRARREERCRTGDQNVCLAYRMHLSSRADCTTRMQPVTRNCWDVEESSRSFSQEKYRTIGCNLILIVKGPPLSACAVSRRYQVRFVLFSPDSVSS